MNRYSVIVILCVAGLFVINATATAGGPPTGACCNSNGTCSDGVTEADCLAAGVAWNEGQFCFLIKCPGLSEIGACCFGDGACLARVQASCDLEGGTFQGGGTDCEFSAACEVAGACCFGDGTCQSDLDETACGVVGGTFLGVETNCPIAACCPAPPSCPEDLSGNAQVDFADVLGVIGAWGACSVCCPEDFSGNGSVDFADVLAVIGAWGACSP